MLFELESMIKSLPPGSIAKLQFHNPHQRIEEARVWSADLISRPYEVLYVTSISMLPFKCTADLPVNLACIVDAPPPEWLLETSAHNLVLVHNIYDPVYFATLFNTHIEYATTKRLQRSYEKLIQALGAGKGLQAITDIGSEILENPIGIADTSYKTLARSADYQLKAENVDSTDLYMMAMLNSENLGQLSHVSIEFLKSSHRYAQISHRLSPYITSKEALQQSGIQAPYSFIDCGVRIKGILVAIFAVADTSRPFQKGDLEYCKQLVSLISLELQKDEFFIRNHGIDYESILNDLLNDQINDSLQVRLRLQAMNKTLKDELRVVTVRKPRNEASDNTGVPTVGQAALRRFFPGCISVVYRDDIVLLIGNDPGAALAIDTNEDLIDLLESNQMKAGVSEVFHDPIQMRKHYQQSVKAIELGIQLKPNKYAYSYYQLSAFHAMEVCSKSISLRDLSHPVINQLNRSENESDKELLKTLYLWLFYDRDASKISEALYIHRSTLFYRLNKIKELIGSDLNDGELIFQLMFSFKIIEYFSSYVNPSDLYWFKHILPDSEE